MIPSISYHPEDDDDYELPVDRKSCSLLGPTALIVQALMGIFVISSLLVKRHREKPKRPWKIWTFDFSKQVVGQAFIHGLNVLISDQGASRSAGRNACVYYFFNVLIDTTFGVAVIYGLLHLLSRLFIDVFHLKGIRSGEYDNPPRFSYWARQAAIYIVVLTAMKLLVVALFAVWPGIIEVGAWLLSWTGSSNAAQVIFVMGIFPIIMNVIQFWIIDSIVKASSQGPVALGYQAASEPLIDDVPSDHEDDDLDPAVSTGTDRDLESALPVKRPSRAGSAEPDEQKVVSTELTPTSPPANDHGSLHDYPPSRSTSPLSQTADGRPSSTRGRLSPLSFQNPPIKSTSRVPPNILVHPPVPSQNSTYGALGQSPPFSKLLFQQADLSAEKRSINDSIPSTTDHNRIALAHNIQFPS